MISWKSNHAFGTSGAAAKSIIELLFHWILGARIHSQLCNTDPYSAIILHEIALHVVFLKILPRGLCLQWCNLNDLNDSTNVNTCVEGRWSLQVGVVNALEVYQKPATSEAQTHHSARWQCKWCHANLGKLNDSSCLSLWHWWMPLYCNRGCRLRVLHVWVKHTHVDGLSLIVQAWWRDVDIKDIPVCDHEQLKHNFPLPGLPHRALFVLLISSHLVN